MGFGCLPEDAPAVLAMFADVVQSPALPLQRIELYKAQVSPGSRNPEQTWPRLRKWCSRRRCRCNASSCTRHRLAAHP